MKPHKFRVGERVRVVLEGTVTDIHQPLDKTCDTVFEIRCADSGRTIHIIDTSFLRPIPRRRKKK